jgi:hypothetical protein
MVKKRKNKYDSLLRLPVTITTAADDASRRDS